MKTKLQYMAGCLLLIGLACLFTLGYTPSQAQSRSNRQPDAIMVQFKATLGPEQPTPNGTTRPPIGFEVSHLSASNPALNTLVGQPAGVAIAALVAEGYQLQWLSVDRMVGVR